MTDSTTSGTPFRATAAAEHLSPAFPERAPRGTADKLRAWQQEALDRYFEHEHRDFLVSATPGAGRRYDTLRRAADAFASDARYVTPIGNLRSTGRSAP